MGRLLAQCLRDCSEFYRAATGGPGHTLPFLTYVCCFVLAAFMLQKAQYPHSNAPVFFDRASWADRSGLRHEIETVAPW